MNGNIKYSNGVCYRCGGKWFRGHAKQCPANGKIGESCKNSRHFSKMCKNKKVNVIEDINNIDNDDSIDEETYSIRLFCIDDNVKERHRWKGSSIDFERGGSTRASCKSVSRYGSRQLGYFKGYGEV